ncbi:glycoside hydrolase family 18 protein [Cylindrobasidium torrendii FP15055 ss-10]|uniref:Glycoside hydrolase family 18 protein n=1 Tax=Cylindrobasidium torrendii FP15055 ss-10 TaxID=1314674 RepID=A0A0D7BU73_9AGAR|nr:glycoside hydrolase family 18 protein [Cylindrobasidium torrendii FP15055 ss-10]
MASTALFFLSFTMPCVILAAPVADNSSSLDTQSEYNSEAVFVYPSQADTPSSAATADASNSSSDARPLVMAYYPDWTSSQFPPEKIDFDYYDWIDFAFALPDESFNLSWDDPETAPALLSRLVDAGHAGGTKIKLSIGGWTGSKHFSDAVSNDENRHTFVKNIVTIYEQFGIDGIDIDWEYPGHKGDADNTVSTLDTPNFLSFLRLLRSQLPTNAVITAATQPAPFVGEDGQPVNNVTEFASLLDWVLIMNYDVWSSSSNPGPNAPFYDACHNSTQPEANAVGAFNAWRDAGLSPSQMVLGIPAYGYLSNSNATSLRTRSAAARRQAAPIRLVTDEDKSEGQILFRSLVSQNALVLNVTSSNHTVFEAAGGFTREWDECSSTPFLRSPDVGQVVSYDDPQSLALKASFVRKVGMLGVNMWEVHGDTDDCDLVKSVRTAFGYEAEDSKPAVQ